MHWPGEVSFHNYLFFLPHTIYSFNMSKEGPNCKKKKKKKILPSKMNKIYKMYTNFVCRRSMINQNCEHTDPTWLLWSIQSIKHIYFLLYYWICNPASELGKSQCLIGHWPQTASILNQKTKQIKAPTDHYLFNKH